MILLFFTPYPGKAGGIAGPVSPTRRRRRDTDDDLLLAVLL